MDPEKDGINSKTFPYIAKWKNNTICGLLRASFTVQMSYTSTDTNLKVKEMEKYCFELKLSRVFGSIRGLEIPRVSFVSDER